MLQRQYPVTPRGERPALRRDPGFPPAPRHHPIQWLPLRIILSRSLACLARKAGAAKCSCRPLTAPRPPPSLPVADLSSHPPVRRCFSRRCRKFSSGRAIPEQLPRGADPLPPLRSPIVTAGSSCCRAFCRRHAPFLLST